MRATCPIERASLAGCLMLLLLLPSGALGQDRERDDEGKQKSESTSSRWRRGGDDDDKGWSGHQYEIDVRTGKKLAAAREFIVAEQYDEAAKALDKLRMRNLNPLERAQAHRLRGYVAHGRGDLASARDLLEKTIAEGVLPRTEVASLRFQIAQLWFQEENWAEGAQHLEIWFTIEPNPLPAAHYMLALAYYQLGDLEKALLRAQMAVDATDEPKEGWLQLLLALRLTRKEYPESVPILEQLVRRFPKKSYFLSLSTVHGALGNNEEALVPLQLAYRQGLLTESTELMRLAQLLLFLGRPYRAAQVLQQGFHDGPIDESVDSLELLSSSWINAREFDRAAEPLEHAARLAEDGELYVRLAQVHIQREKWQAAARALELGIDKRLENPGEAHLLMGIALHSQKRPAQARTWFARAREHSESREEAEIWLQYIERELASL